MFTGAPPGFRIDVSMRTLFIFIWSLGCLAGCADPAATAVDTTAEKAAIRALLLAQQADWNAGRIEHFMEGYIKADTLRFVGGSGEILGWDNTLQRYLHAYPDRAAMGTLTFDLRDIDLLGPAHAVVFGAYSLARVSDNPTGLFTLVLVKTEGDWRIVHDHTTADQP